jgi:hypothetical protein
MSTHTIEIDGKNIEISIEVKPYFRNETLQPIYIYRIPNNNSETSHIITYFIRGISNNILTVIGNYNIFDILNKNYKTLLPDFSFLSNI